MTDVDFTSLFKTERLVFRAIADDAADREFIADGVLGDPQSLGTGIEQLLRPLNKMAIDELLSLVVSKVLLGVMICLPGEEEEDEDVKDDEPLSDEAASKLAEKKREKEKRMKTQPWKKPKPIPIGFLVVGFNNAPWEAHIRDVTFSIGIAVPWQNKGYGFESLNWALDWTFRVANMHRASIEVLGWNPRGYHLYKKLGLVEEGRMRKKMYYNLQWYDRIQLGMLREEWEVLRGLRPSESLTDNSL